MAVDGVEVVEKESVTLKKWRLSGAEEVSGDRVHNRRRSIEFKMFMTRRE